MIQKHLLLQQQQQRIYYPQSKSTDIEHVNLFVNQEENRNVKNLLSEQTFPELDRLSYSPSDLTPSPLCRELGASLVSSLGTLSWKRISMTLALWFSLLFYFYCIRAICIQVIYYSNQVIY